jgi:hypothetical protein
MLTETQIKNYSFPKGYVPFESINFCSNLLTKPKIIIAADNVAPLIIGVGKVPAIWLKAYDGKKWISILENNKPTHPLTNSAIVNDTIIVNAGDKTLIRANIVGGICNVLYLDLRLIGLNIYGDANGLNIAGNSFTSNTIEGAAIVFKVTMHK